jgi:hypothetical protein
VSHCAWLITFFFVFASEITCVWILESFLCVKIWGGKFDIFFLIYLHKTWNNFK